MPTIYKKNWIHIKVAVSMYNLSARKETRNYRRIDEKLSKILSPYWVSWYKIRRVVLCNVRVGYVRRDERTAGKIMHLPVLRSSIFCALPPHTHTHTLPQNIRPNEWERKRVPRKCLRGKIEKATKVIVLYHPFTSAKNVKWQMISIHFSSRACAYVYTRFYLSFLPASTNP